VVGRLSEKKNHSRIIKAFKQLLDKNPACMLAIVGTGPMDSELRGLVRDLHLDEQIHFLGFRRDVPDILRAGDVFLMPSMREGLPLALLEAMAACLPVITSDVNGIREVIAGMDCGWLVDPTSEDAIAAAILAAAQLPTEQLIAMGKRGKAHVIANFSKERMVSNYEALFDSTLAKSTSS